MKLRGSINKAGGVQKLLSTDDMEKKLPRLVKYEMKERDFKEWGDTKKEFARRYNLKKIINGNLASQNSL